MSFNLYNTVSFDEMIKIRVNNPIMNIKNYKFCFILRLHYFFLTHSIYKFVHLYTCICIRILLSDCFILSLAFIEVRCLSVYMIILCRIVELWNCGSVVPSVWIL